MLSRDQLKVSQPKSNVATYHHKSTLDHQSTCQPARCGLELALFCIVLQTVKISHTFAIVLEGAWRLSAPVTQKCAIWRHWHVKNCNIWHFLRRWASVQCAEPSFGPLDCRACSGQGLHTAQKPGTGPAIYPLALVVGAGAPDLGEGEADLGEGLGDALGDADLGDTG